MIKAGQALSSRPDLLPADYLEELQKLQDRLPPFENELAFQVVEQDLGVPFDQVFELEEEDPIAAASIGQVYKARLRSTGEVVAVKVQRPRCEEIISVDLYVLRWYAGLINRILGLLKRDIDVIAIIDDFGELIYRCVKLASFLSCRSMSVRPHSGSVCSQANPPACFLVTPQRDRLHRRGR